MFLHREGAMITPLIHRALTREDLARLVAEIGRLDQAEARAAQEAVQAGEVDAVLDSPAALEAVRGRGGVPAAVPLPLLWYVPVRAAAPGWDHRVTGSAAMECAQQIVVCGHVHEAVVGDGANDLASPSPSPFEASLLRMEGVEGVHRADEDTIASEGGWSQSPGQESLPPKGPVSEGQANQLAAEGHVHARGVRRHRRSIRRGAEHSAPDLLPILRSKRPDHAGLDQGDECPVPEDGRRHHAGVERYVPQSRAGRGAHGVELVPASHVEDTVFDDRRAYAFKLERPLGCTGLPVQGNELTGLERQIRSRLVQRPRRGRQRRQVRFPGHFHGQQRGGQGTGFGSKLTGASQLRAGAQSDEQQ